tara:strand:- start:413 stop:1300 length:888 start_codon:yes stop_codon:yes gene_type:complete
MANEGVNALSVYRLPKFSPENIGKIIGPSTAACQKNDKLKKLPSLRNSVITPTWRSYKTFKKDIESQISSLEKEMKSSPEETERLSEKVSELRSLLPINGPKTPYIRLDSDDEGVFATIESDSEEMIKFVKFHLNKYQDSFRVPQKMNVYSLYATLSHDSIGAMIGRGGSTRKALVTEAVANMDEDVSPEDLKNCEKSIVKFNPFTPKESFEDFNEMVKGSEKHEYVGWPPEANDPLVKVHVTNFASSEAFEDFVECLKDSVNQRVTEISRRDNEFSERRVKDLQDVQEALNSDW